MSFWKVLKSRRSVRRFKKNPLDRQTLLSILEAARFAPSACNEQHWTLIIVESSHLKTQLVEAGVSSLILRAPHVIVVAYREERLSYKSTSAAAAAENILLAATEAGVGSLWVSPSGDLPRIKSILGIPKEFAIVCLVLLGYPRSETKTSPIRRPISEIVSFNSYSGKMTIKSSHNPNHWTIPEIASHQRYYCRRTYLGRPVLVIDTEEKLVLRQFLSFHVPNDSLVLDILSYDGSLLSLFPASSEIVSVELSDQTAAYVKEASKNRNPVLVFDGTTLPFRGDSLSCVTLLLKVERIPRSDRTRLIQEVARVLKKGGSLILAYRRSYSLYGLVYRLLRVVFRDDIRSSAVFCFFGPYEPLNEDLLDELRSLNLSLSCRKVFLFPPVLKRYAILLKRWFSGAPLLDHTLGETLYPAINAAASFINSLPGRSMLGSLMLVTGTKE